MALVGLYDASTFVEGNYATYPPLPPGAIYYQPTMWWEIIGAGIIQGQSVVVGDLIFATQGAGRLYGQRNYGDQIYGGLSDGDWTVDQVFFLRWDSTLPPPDQPPYPNAGCAFTRDDTPGGDWAPGWRIVIDAFYNDRVGSRTYGAATYGDEVYGDTEATSPHWVDITPVAYHLETGDGTRDGTATVVVAELVLSVLDPEGTAFDIATPATWYQPQPGTALRVGFLGPQHRYFPVFTGEIERIEDRHDGEHPRTVDVRAFGRIMDLTVDMPAVARPQEHASERYAALVGMAGWWWDNGVVVFPYGDAELLADDVARDIVVRDELDRTVQACGWFLDSDRRGRMRVRSWPHEPTGEPLRVVDCREEDVPPVELEPGYLTPSVGTVLTPDPGPLPAEHTFVFRVRGPSSGSGTVAAQMVNFGQYAWRLERRQADWVLVTMMGDATQQSTSLITRPAPSGSDETLALSVVMDNGAARLLTAWVETEGELVPAATANGGAVNPVHDSTDQLRVGAWSTTAAPVSVFNGRIYSVELRTGLDPTAGSLVWRFDADDYPGGDATSYTDPRGRTWTLSAPGAIVPAVIDPGQPGDPDTVRVSHSMMLVNDEGKLLNRVVATNATAPAGVVDIQDDLSVSRFGRRGRALGFPWSGQPWKWADNATMWAQRILNRFAWITRHVEQLDADTLVDPGWLAVLVDLDTGQALTAERRGIAPLTLDAVVVGWRHTIDPGHWQAEVYTSTTTPSM